MCQQHSCDCTGRCPIDSHVGQSQTQAASLPPTRCLAGVYLLKVLGKKRWMVRTTPNSNLKSLWVPRGIAETYFNRKLMWYLFSFPPPPMYFIFPIRTHESKRNWCDSWRGLLLGSWVGGGGQEKLTQQIWIMLNKQQLQRWSAQVCWPQHGEDPGITAVSIRNHTPSFQSLSCLSVPTSSCRMNVQRSPLISCLVTEGITSNCLVAKDLWERTAHLLGDGLAFHSLRKVQTPVSVFGAQQNC